MTTGKNDSGHRHRRMPIWLAALMASECRASGNGPGHHVDWDCESGRALYTNSGSACEEIKPLGVTLEGGHTVVISWDPGETGYTVEVLST